MFMAQGDPPQDNSHAMCTVQIVLINKNPKTNGSKFKTLFTKLYIEH